MNDSEKWFDKYEKDGYPTTRAEDIIIDMDEIIQIIQEAFNHLIKVKDIDLAYSYKVENKAKRKDGRKITLNIQYPKQRIEGLELYEANFRRYMNFPYGDKYISNMNPAVQRLPLHEVLVVKIAAWIYGLGVDYKIL